MQPVIEALYQPIADIERLRRANIPSITRAFFLGRVLQVFAGRLNKIARYFVQTDDKSVP